MKNDLMFMLGGLLSSAVSAKSESGKLEKCTVNVDSKDYIFQIYLPPNAENTPDLPVIIFLHGIGQRGNGGFVPTTGAGSAIAKHYLGQIPAIILLPQCRSGSYWSDPVMEKMVVKSLTQTVEEFNADEKRIYLTGVSMGGYGVWYLASQFPKKFAALISICGGSSISKGDRFDALAKKVGKTPAWLFHGADDVVVPVTESRQIAAALKANCGSVKYNEYENVGHNVWMNALGEKDLMSWLLAQHL
ncbi:MAG: alpha/beta fold hydrolase [Acidobacteriota bacterium]